MAAAWMTFATETMVVILASMRLRRTLALPLIPRPGRVGRTFAAAAALGGALGALRLGGAGLPVLVPVACVLYPTLLLGLRALALDDVRLVLRRGAHA
jgi:hypothetical protein